MSSLKGCPYCKTHEVQTGHWNPCNGNGTCYYNQDSHDYGVSPFKLCNSCEYNGYTKLLHNKPAVKAGELPGCVNCWVHKVIFGHKNFCSGGGSCVYDLTQACPKHTMGEWGAAKSEWPWGKSTGCEFCFKVWADSDGDTNDPCEPKVQSSAAKKGTDAGKGCYNKFCVYSDLSVWDSVGGPTPEEETPPWLELADTTTPIDMWPWRIPKLKGCEACFAYYQSCGHSNPCLGKGPGTLNKNCRYYEEWGHSGPPPIPTSRKDVERNFKYHAMNPEESDIEAGKELGLDPHLELPKSCADFYILERLCTDLWEVIDDPRRGHRLPIRFGSDSRLELLAYDARIRFDGLVKKLAEQFWKYISSACGGELRHAQIASSGREEGCNHSCNDDCCEHDDPDETHCGHEEHDEYCWISPGETGTTYDNLPGQLGELFAGEHGTYIRGERSLAWLTWSKFFDTHGPEALDWAAELFVAPRTFNGGYGGKYWAEAASLTADYLRGKVKPRTYVDRCWALQHNGCSLFNKFFQLHSRLNKMGSPIKRKDNPKATTTDLDTVLEVQHDYDYSILSEFAGSYTQEMFNRVALARMKGGGTL